MFNNFSPNNIKPSNGYLLVQPAIEEKKTNSGIYLPDNHKEKHNIGTVVSVGSSLLSENGAEIKAPASKGETVLYKAKEEWNENSLKLDGVEYQFLRFDDILAVISK